MVEIAKNKKGFTLVELLAVIVVLAIVMSLAVVAITGVLDNARKSSFVTDAKSFLDGARTLVTSDDMNAVLGSGTSNYAPHCANGTGETKFIPLIAISLDNGGTRSPYGNNYVKSDADQSITTINRPTNYSYVEVTSKYTPNAINTCPTTYKIFLYDGVYSIGTAAVPLSNDEVGTDKVQVYTGSATGQGS